MQNIKSKKHFKHFFQLFLTESWMIFGCTALTVAAPQITCTGAPTLSLFSQKRYLGLLGSRAALVVAST
jgi:hypothetical protein